MELWRSHHVYKYIANTAISQLDYRKIATMYGNGNLWSFLAAPILN